MNSILDYIKNIKKYQHIVNTINKSNETNIYLGNCASNLGKMFCALSYLNSSDSYIYITENIFEASKAYEVFCDLVGIDEVSFFPQEEFISSELVASSKNFKLARMQTLYNIVNNKKQLIVTCCEGATKRVMSKDRIKRSSLSIKVGMDYPLKKLAKDLICRGYKKSPVSYEMGTFSIRGSIVDIYPINETSLFRIYYDFDEIEAIKEVDIESQLSKQRVDDINIFPLYEMYYEEDEIPSIIDNIKKYYTLNEKIDKDLLKISEYNSLDQLNIYLPFIDNEYTSFLELFTNPICFYEDLSGILRHEEASLIELQDYFLAVGMKFPKDFFISIMDIIPCYSKNIYISHAISSLNGIKLTSLIDVKSINNLDYNNNIKLVISDLKSNLNRTYIVTHFDEAKLNFLREIFNNNELEYNLYDIEDSSINLVVCKNAYGFIDYELNIEVLTPNEYSPGKISKSSKYNKYYKSSVKVYSKDDLKPGDYVIHQDYGIGIYAGIETRNIRNHLIDYIKVIFANEQSLLIPIESIFLLEKYNNSKDTLPKLNSIDGKEWKKKKERIKEKVVDVAKRLIKVQAERATKKGYIYNEDTEDQIKFEAEFEYNETADQLKAINEVKQDMENERPVDRLICGDVGFGKTEVAMRAAFKVVENSKQVAYLAPTTVLTRQHFYTFKDRFEKYGYRVELLNRFVPAKKQKDIIEGLKKGYVDIVIGTHRLLSDEIKYKDLGMLIVDEEQRFGVMHKEKIKELKANVDVLTLTATPIPRTLQMSLSGLRDLSLIETPPSNRLPIQTYVLENNESVIREAINRELGRGGQVFYLLNRIDELDIVIRKIQRLAPHAKTGKIHGRMDKDEIEAELIKFLDRNYDILVCTTIIETGIDIPNANTLIIEKADHLGLSQLYQIRGRVGRSDRISYAYLTYDSHSVLTDVAKKRLDAIKEFTALGSGYKIAMRDLAIRGAGDILGDEQSGFIDAIGMDLYMKLLNDAINNIKGVKQEEEEYRYNISVDKHVETDYVNDEEIRIAIHKDICKIKSREQITSLIKEFTDRFGKLSPSILTYMEEKYLEYLLKSRGVEKIVEKDSDVVFTFDEYSTAKLDFKEMAKIKNSQALNYIFSLDKNKLRVDIPLAEYLPNKSDYIFTLTKFLEHIV